MQNKKLVGTLSHWVIGTPSASAKRSAEQKSAEQKSAEQKLVGTLGHASIERSAEQKCGTKIG